MINLIPPHARKQVKIEYWTRVASVWIFLMAAGLLIFAVLLIPSYVLINAQLSAYEVSYAEATANDESYQELERVVKKANTNATTLLTQNDPRSFTDIIDELELITNNTIDVTKIFMERSDAGTVEQIIVTGVAATRIDLVAYKDAIEAHAFFLSADLPLSDLAKDREVPFSLTVAMNVAE